MPNIEKVTEIYNGVSVECAHLTIDKAGQTYRFSKVFDTTSEYNMIDDYAWQMIAKANGNKSITLTVGDKNTTFSLTTAFARYTNIFYSVNPSTYPYVEIVFPTTGEYWFYHVQLEHGNTITDWHSETEDAVIIATENMTEAVKKWTTFYDTKFEKTDESIKLNARAITANADNIAEVRSNMEASFEIQADQISSIVTDIETLDDKVDTNNSTITQRADSISSSVTALSTNLANNYYTKSLIDQKSDKITLAVFGKQSGDFSVDDVVNNINSSASVVIGQGHIDLQGYVTFTNLSGAQSTSNNTIINGSHLTTGTIGSSNSNTQWDLTNGIFTMRKGSLNLGYDSTLGDYKFKVTDAGALTARSGYIGNGTNGFTIGNTNIRNGMTAYTDTTNNGVYVGTEGIALGKGAFKVSNTGALSLSGENSSISITNGSSTIFSANKNGASITGTVNITGGSLNLNNGNLIIDSSGNIHSKGNIYAQYIYGLNANGQSNNPYFYYGKDSGYDSGNSDVMIANTVVARNLYIKSGNVQITGSGSNMDDAPNYINLAYRYAISTTSHTTSTYVSASYFQATDEYESTSLKYYNFAKMSYNSLYFGTKVTNLVTQAVSTEFSQYIGLDGIEIVNSNKHGVFRAKTSAQTSTGTHVVIGSGNGTGTARFLDKVILPDGGSSTVGTNVYDGATLRTLSNYITSRFTFVEPQTVTYTLYKAGSDTTRYTLPTGTTIQYVMYMRFGYLVYVYFSINVSTAPSANISFDIALPTTVPTARIKKSGSTADPGQYDAALGAMSSSGSAGRMWILGNTRKVSIRLPKIVTYYTGVLIYPTSSI